MSYSKFSMFNYKIYFLSIVMFVWLAAAQQPGQNGIVTTGLQATAPVSCNFTTVKPTPQAKLYSHLTCTLAKFAAYLSIGEGKFIELSDGTVDTSRSDCGKKVKETVDQILVVTFPCAEIEFDISHSANDSKIFIKSIQGFYKINDLKVNFGNSTPAFETFQTGHYYKCNADQSITVADNTQLILRNFAYEAYRNAKGTDFYKVPEECALDMGEVSYMTRIGVAICLVALFVIILIAYFVGRRRWSERSSYESV